MYFPDEMPKEPTRKRKWPRRLFMTVLVLVFLFGAGIAILSRMGGNDDNLRAGLENIIAKAAGGHAARVDKLHGFVFFPYLRVYADGVTVMSQNPDSDRPDQLGTPLMTIGTIMFSRNFWDAFLQRPYVEGIMLDNINTIAGYLLPRPLQQASLILSDKSFEGGPGAELFGRYDGQEFSLLIGLTHHLRDNRPVYGMDKNPAFILTSGDLTLRGTWTRGRTGLDITIDELNWKQQGPAKPLLPAKLTANFRRTNNINQLTVNHETANSALTLTYEGGAQSGLTIDAANLHHTDLVPLLSFYEQLAHKFFGAPDKPDFGGLQRLAVRVEKYSDENREWGKFAFTGPFDQDGTYRSDNLKGTILGGTLTGALRFSSAAGATATLNLSGFTGTDGEKYRTLQAELNASGKSLVNYTETLTGTATLEPPCRTGAVRLKNGKITYNPQSCPAQNQ